MMKKLLLRGRQRWGILATLLLLAVAAWAVPAKPGLTRLLTLSNGTTVTATLVGDEYGHCWKGADGKSYQAVAGTKIPLPLRHPWTHSTSCTLPHRVLCPHRPLPRRIRS